MHPDVKYIIANLSGIPRILNTVYRRRPLVLAYHGIYDGDRRPEDLPPTFIHVDDLKAQLEALKRFYRILSPERFVHFIRTRTPLPPFSALITFDDGYESFGRLAAPVLERLGIRAIVFVATHFVETMNPFWFDIAWLYLKELTAGRCKPLTTIGSPILFDHGNDAVMSALKAMNQKQRDQLVAEMRADLEQCRAPSVGDLRLFYPLSPQKLKSLSDNGFSVGGHTHSHTILSTLSDDQAAEEIRRNTACIEDFTSRPCRLFAYPNGGCSDFLPVHKEILHRSGYIASFSLTQRRSKPAKDFMDISRMNVAPEDSIRSLSFRACGTTPIIETFKSHIMKRNQ
jgi:peptidoglycan/xylan/chitin deacetylase (PgdA/CDA1 family)